MQATAVPRQIAPDIHRQIRIGIVDDVVARQIERREFRHGVAGGFSLVMIARQQDTAVHIHQQNIGQIEGYWSAAAHIKRKLSQFQTPRAACQALARRRLNCCGAIGCWAAHRANHQAIRLRHDAQIEQRPFTRQRRMRHGRAQPQLG